MREIEHEVKGFGNLKADDFFAFAEHGRAHRETEDPWEYHFAGFSDPQVWRNSSHVER